MNNRDKSDIFEREAAQAINNIINNKDNNNFSKGVKITAQLIVKEFPNVTEANWSGEGSYNKPGDITLKLSDARIIYIELKTSKGNSQNKSNGACTKQIKGLNLLSYSDFDKCIGERKRRYEYLSNETNTNIYLTKDYEKKCYELRTPDKDWIGHEHIEEFIIKSAAISKSKYSEYLKEHLGNLSKDKLLNFVKLIHNGKHTLNSNEDYIIIKITNSNNDKAEVAIEKYIVNEIKDISISGFQLQLINERGKVVLSIIPTWGNGGQGVKTPCIHSFF